MSKKKKDSIPDELKESYWDNPVYPGSKSPDRLLKNNPDKKGYMRSNYQEGVGEKFNQPLDKYWNTIKNRDSKHKANKSRNFAFSNTERARNRLDARKAGLEQEYPAGCNLTKKDIFEEYPDATIICSSCNFMLKGDTPTIYIDCIQCENNEYEIKTMQKHERSK